MLVFCILQFSIQAQHLSEKTNDSLQSKESDTLFLLEDQDSISLALQDSLHHDSVPIKKISPNAIEKVVKYEAVDSIRMDIKNGKAYFYNQTVVYYDDMELHADYNETDFKNNELFASGVADDNGIIHGSPVFLQGEGVYYAQEIKYNFTTQKGKISRAITSEGEGYIHGEHVKKLEDFSYIQSGRYTTCELDDPHFEIAFTKAKVIPDDKIVTGPAYLKFGGVPTFLAIPFGFFPNHKGRSSGLIMPTIRETRNRGFGFEGIGFYFGISDHIDLTLTADIFTRGSWAINAYSTYILRYKFTGKLELSFAQNFFGERYTSSFNKSNDFKVVWEHTQNPKSHPTTRFSASINFVTSSYNRYNPSSAYDYLSNEYASSVNLSTSAKNFFYLSTSLRYSQNIKTGITNISLPEMNMSINQFYPFRSKKRKGTLKWYDNITLRWSSEFSGKIDTRDSLLLKPETWEQIKLGMKHNIPLTVPIKIAKLINWNTSVNFTERFYFQRIEKVYNTEDSSVNTLFYRNFNALHELSLVTSLRTSVYFMYQSKKGPQALRHVMKPDLSFTFRPNINGTMQGQYFDPVRGQNITYSYFENSAYGVPNAKSQAIARLSISNNLEMKVKSRRDTITGMQKIVLFDDITISTGYDFIADSLNWDLLRISGRTTLFRQLSITFNIGLDPYRVGENGTRINETEWKVNKKLFRLSSSSLTLGFNWTFDQNTFKGKGSKETAPNQTILDQTSLGIHNKRPDFSTPWSFTLNYTFSYNVNDNLRFYRGEERNKHTHDIIQTLGLSGDFNVTKKWKIGFSTGYDFQNKKITYTSIDIYRDLHCWEMRFNWIPFGYQRGFSFTINVKASSLQDIKYNMKRDFRDNL